MQTIKLDVNDPKSIDGAAKVASEILQNGGTVVYPTDTAYGLGANALNEAAVEKVFRIKQRSKEKPLSVAVKDVAMAKKIAVVSAIAEKFLQHVWPGPVTVILPKRSCVPDILTNGRPMGLRCPKYPLNEAFFKYIDFPITVTSANISGEVSVYDLKEFTLSIQRRRLACRTDREPRPDLLIDAGLLPQILPSTIIDLTGKEPKILRVGPVSTEQLLNIFKSL